VGGDRAFVAPPVGDALDRISCAGIRGAALDALDRISCAGIRGAALAAREWNFRV